MLSAWIAECNLPTIGNICVLGSLLIFRAAHKASPVKHFRADLTDAEVPEASELFGSNRTSSPIRTGVE